MKVVKTIEEVRRVIAASRQRGRSIGFVPTMGALHVGHRSLIEAARSQSDFVVVSIFVNPTQFGPGEDFERYPRPLEADLNVCEEDSVDCLFVPETVEIYPQPRVTTVTVSQLTRGLCGPFRPGHFDGVTTVVAKLFNIVAPDAAYFGEKDYQQLVVIQRMVKDLDFPVRIAPCPTVRESDGLAVSSRNAYLSPAGRAQAPSIYTALCHGASLAREGECDAHRITQAVRGRIEASGPCRIDYISLVDADTLQPIEHLKGRARLCVAVHVEQTRLIDNVAVDAPGSSS